MAEYVKLQGSEKQIAWAEKIRATELGKLIERAAEMERHQAEFVTPEPVVLQTAAYYRSAAERLGQEQASAAWWIDNRNRVGDLVRQELRAQQYEAARQRAEQRNQPPA